jgi:hypothetical protein
MAMVSKSHKFIYISGGRNATGAIKAALLKIPNLKYFEPSKLNKSDWKKFDKHMPARFIKQRIGSDVWNPSFKFTFVRNTYSWVVSSIGFWIKIGMLKMPKNEIFTMDEFRFAVKYYQSPQGLRHDTNTNIRSQHSFICNDNGKIMVDFVGRFEYLQEDFNKICKKIGVKPIELTRQNSSVASRGKVHWKEHYRQNPEAKDFVYKHWKRDIDAFNFQLEL